MFSIVQLLHLSSEDSVHLHRYTVMIRSKVITRTLGRRQRAMPFDLVMLSFFDPSPASHCL